MEDMTVTKALFWLETQALTNACILRLYAMNMLRKIKAGWRRREWLVSLRRSHLVRIYLIFLPGHAEVRGSDRADRIAGTSIISTGPATYHTNVLHALREVGIWELLEKVSKTLWKD
jgi:hypothetical protein